MRRQPSGKGSPKTNAALIGGWLEQSATFASESRRSARDLRPVNQVGQSTGLGTSWMPYYMSGRLLAELASPNEGDS
jgi:hypothetical protein